MIRSLPDVPWDEWVQRVVLHIPHYFTPSGSPKSGGLQRKVRDVAHLIRSVWGRECVIAQKASSNWERIDSVGNPVLGIKSRIGASGDPGFGRATARLLRPGDAIVYMGGEDAWPYIVPGAKGFHVGIWWDGPIEYHKKIVAGIRTEALFRVTRSMLCVDTNVINWLRARSRRNQEAANRARYLPNAVDLDKVPSQARTEPHQPLRLLFARRYEVKRGPELALDAVAILRSRGMPVRLLMSTAQGQAGSEQIQKGAEARGISDQVEVHENDMDSIFNLYHQADAAIVPTIWSEGTSYSCVEAIAAGLPVVTTTVGGLPNLVLPGFNGIVSSPRPHDLANAIEQLTDPERWRQMHEHCLSMRDAFSKDAWLHNVLSWLKS